MRVVTFGELLLRLSPPGEERLLESPELHTCFGGAEANVAVALSHLGVRCDYVTRVPDNPLGDAGVEALRKEGVGTRWIARGGSGDRLGLYFVEPGVDLRAMRVVYDRAGSAFARLDPHSIDWPAVLAGADWFHVSGITPALGEGPVAALAGAIACARARGTPVSLDLNYREALWRDRNPRPLLEPLARRAGVLIGNPAAVSAMLGLPADDASLASPERARALAEQLAARVIPSFRWFGPADSIPLAHIRQIPGVTGVVSALYDVPVGEVWSRERLGTLKAQIEDAGLRFAVVESIPVHENIKLGRRGRDRLIENFCRSVCSMGDHGVPVLCYNFMPVFDWTRTDLARRLPDGSTALAYDDAALAQLDLSPGAPALPGSATAYQPAELQALIAAYREVDAERLWDSLADFLERG